MSFDDSTAYLGCAVSEAILQIRCLVQLTEVPFLLQQDSDGCGIGTFCEVCGCRRRMASRLWWLIVTPLNLTTNQGLRCFYLQLVY